MCTQENRATIGYACFSRRDHVSTLYHTYMHVLFSYSIVRIYTYDVRCSICISMTFNKSSSTLNPVQKSVCELKPLHVFYLTHEMQYIYIYIYIYIQENGNVYVQSPNNLYILHSYAQCNLNE